MEWIRQNWVFILFFVIFIAMHLFGHGMHGGHSRRGEGESFLYGVYVGIVFVPIYNFINRKWCKIET